MQRGYVYVLTNACMPDLVKIGQTKRSPSKRARELSQSTGVPTPFEVAHQEIIIRWEEAERGIHRQLEQFRYNPDREFFQIPLQEAIRVVAEVARKYRKLEQAQRERAERGEAERAWIERVRLQWESAEYAYPRNDENAVLSYLGENRNVAVSDARKQMVSPVVDGFIRFLCPHCGNPRKSRSEYAGRKARCSCGGGLIIPGRAGDNSPGSAWLWYLLISAGCLLIGIVGIVALAKADPNVRAAVLIAFGGVCIFALITTIVSLVRQCGWWEGARYTALGILLILATMVVVLDAMSKTGRGRRRR